MHGLAFVGIARLALGGSLAQINLQRLCMQTGDASGSPTSGLAWLTTIRE